MQGGAETQLAETQLLGGSHRRPQGDEDQDRSPRSDPKHDATDLPAGHTTERERTGGRKGYDDGRKEGDGGHAPAKGTSALEPLDGCPELLRARLLFRDHGLRRLSAEFRI